MGAHVVAGDCKLCSDQEMVPISLEESMLWLGEHAYKLLGACALSGCGGEISSPARPHLTFHPKPKQQLYDCREPGLSQGLMFDFLIDQLLGFLPNDLVNYFP